MQLYKTRNTAAMVERDLILATLNNHKHKTEGLLQNASAQKD